MTAEKQKHRHFESRFALNHKISRREARKYIRAERRETKQCIREGIITKKTRFACNYCGVRLKLYEWLIEAGAVIRCPKCGKEIMDICFTERKEAV
jgi:DNA-directed RNA polymerase subunit RPC12/RpoP